MVHEASELDGRLARQPLKDICKELRAMQAIHARIKSQIQDHTEALLVSKVKIIVGGDTFLGFLRSFELVRLSQNAHIQVVLVSTMCFTCMS